ncbi:MAG: rhomboid family intramembrane serine protease [Proteobacteria bacterium]|nr:rhomboid family intramembrane serine protease [Pseudomonadota bacterium]MCP4918913.1 rhomboid family intramembrane serine protease [Pseudomonadota bacterium]
MRGNPGGFGIEFTELTKRALIVLVSLYIVQLLLTYWLHFDVSGWLYLNRFGEGWAPWQPLTALLFNAPSPLSAAFDWLILLFFLGPCERLMGRKKLLTGLAISAAIAAVFTFVLDLSGSVVGTVPFVGLNPLLTALLVFFGLTLPNATIRLWFVLPVKAAWFAWGSGLLSLLYFLASRDLDSTMALGGWIGAFIVMKVGPDEWRKILLRWRARNVEKELEKFTVIDGGRDGDDDEYIH